MMTKKCDPEMMKLFLIDALDLDDKLEFLFHLDDCEKCWDDLYRLRVAEHAHFYFLPLTPEDPFHHPEAA